jgi:hypothetical protein
VLGLAEGEHGGCSSRFLADDDDVDLVLGARLGIVDDGRTDVGGLATDGCRGGMFEGETAGDPCSSPTSAAHSRNSQALRGTIDTRTDCFQRRSSVTNGQMEGLVSDYFAHVHLVMGSGAGGNRTLPSIQN